MIVEDGEVVEVVVAFPSETTNVVAVWVLLLLLPPLTVVVAFPSPPVPIGGIILIVGPPPEIVVSPGFVGGEFVPKEVSLVAVPEGELVFVVEAPFVVDC